MVQQNAVNENANSDLNISFIASIKELDISRLLTQCGVRKDSRMIKGESTNKKRSVFEIFQFLLLMAFQGCNLYRFLGSKKQDIACSKSTYHRFLSNEHYNWKRFILLLSAKVTIFFDSLTAPGRFRALVLDDSVIARKRSKKVELLAFIFDHVIGKSVRGFNLLMLGWTDGYSFIPIAFNMLSSAKQENRFCEVNPKIDRRTNGYKARMAAMMQKPDAAIAMIKSALEVGVPAEYVLMDTWFTNEPFIKRILGCGLNVIGMLKNNKQMYHLRGKLYNLDSLASYFAHMHKPGDFLGSVVVKTRREKIPVKLVFVRNRNKRSEYIIILSTDCSLSDEEIVRRYGYRWSIECCFKVCKSLLKLGKEFQPVNYDTTVSSTALVLTRFILLEWIRRKNSDPHSLGEIFFLCYDDVQDIELVVALGQLMSLISEGLANGTIQMDESVQKEIINWYVSQPAFIRCICQKQMEESGLLPTAERSMGKMSTVV
jgi:hypothetical protein